MIELQNLTKSFHLTSGQRRYVFRDLNFAFPEGANIGLIGRNGAGKSTLLRLLGGIDQPDHGRVVTDKRISWPVGLSGGLQPSLTGRDSVKFVCRVYGTTREEMLEKIAFVQDFAEIGEYFDQPVRSYSSGMRARLNFGLSWAFDFDYYLMDEIGAVGDARFKQKSRELMESRITRSNIILVSHAMPEIARLCNVVVLVDAGQAILYEDVDEGIRAYQQAAGVPQPKKPQPPTGAAHARQETRI
jgi:capsular polysaccharide transport system ATP-binding protein